MRVEKHVGGRGEDGVVREEGGGRRGGDNGGREGKGRGEGRGGRKGGDGEK